CYMASTLTTDVRPRENLNGSSGSTFFTPLSVIGRFLLLPRLAFIHYFHLHTPPPPVLSKKTSTRSYPWRRAQFHRHCTIGQTPPLRNPWLREGKTCPHREKTFHRLPNQSQLQLHDKPEISVQPIPKAYCYPSAFFHVPKQLHFLINQDSGRTQRYWDGRRPGRRNFQNGC